jgi:hypothetical protein
MFGRILAAGLVVILTCSSGGCFWFHRCWCHHRGAEPCCAPCAPAACGCGGAAFYPPGPPGPIPPIPPAGMGAVPLPGPEGLGYTPMPTAAPPTAQARIPLR